mgnify:FL=1
MVYVFITIFILIIFLILIRQIVLEIQKKHKLKTCKKPTISPPSSNPEPIEEKKDEPKCETCPNLDEYIHRSELVPNLSFRVNPYFVKGKPKKNLKKIKKLKKRLEEKSNACRKTDGYQYDWIPVLESECAV